MRERRFLALTVLLGCLIAGAAAAEPIAASRGRWAGPIGEALIATAFGIAAALPAVLAYNYFLRRLRLNLTDFQNFADDFARLARKYDYKV